MDDLVEISCCECGCKFGLPDDLYNVARCSSDINFYCPYGHVLHFPTKTKEKNKVENKQIKDNVVQLRVVKNDDAG